MLTGCMAGSRAATGNGVAQQSDEPVMEAQDIKRADAENLVIVLPEIKGAHKSDPREGQQDSL